MDIDISAEERDLLTVNIFRTNSNNYVISFLNCIPTRLHVTRYEIVDKEKSTSVLQKTLLPNLAIVV